MNVAKLREMLSHVPDETPIVVPGENHSFNIASAYSTTVVVEGRGKFGEDGGKSLGRQAIVR